MNRAEFCEYLEQTLIPDLRADGMMATAADFHAALLFIRGAEEVKIGDGEAEEVGFLRPFLPPY